MAGRLTIGLYNSYDPTHFHEAMRRAVVRAAPLAAAFGFNLCLVGFPMEAYRTKAGEAPKPKTPVELANVLAESTSIGEGGEYLLDLARQGRLVSFPFPDRGFPPQLGRVVLATEDPEETKKIGLSELGRDIREGRSCLIVVGLGPRGVPKKISEMATHHLELTGAGYSLETATALGVLAGRMASAIAEAYAQLGPRLSTDAIVERDGRVLLVRRGKEPFQGRWALPGGFVDAGETAEAAVLRELSEETGLVGRAPKLVGAYSDPARDPRFHSVSLAFAVQAQGEPRGGDDAAEAAFHPWGALPELAFDHARMLADYRRRPTPP